MGTYRGYYYHHHCCFSNYFYSFSRWFIGVVWSLGVVSGGGLLVMIDYDDERMVLVVIDFYLHICTIGWSMDYWM